MPAAMLPAAIVLLVVATVVAAEVTTAVVAASDSHETASGHVQIPPCPTPPLNNSPSGQLVVLDTTPDWQYTYDLHEEFDFSAKPVYDEEPQSGSEAWAFAVRRRMAEVVIECRVLMVATLAYGLNIIDDTSLKF